MCNWAPCLDSRDSETGTGLFSSVSHNTLCWIIAWIKTRRAHSERRFLPFPSHWWDPKGQIKRGYRSGRGWYENKKDPTNLEKDWWFCSHGNKEPPELVLNLFIYWWQLAEMNILLQTYQSVSALAYENQAIKMDPLQQKQMPANHLSKHTFTGDVYRLTALKVHQPINSILLNNPTWHHQSPLFLETVPD